ncbi:MAG: methyltransferase domain-containing protein [Candidatus Lokiarchaeota archaeon]|nr:methyltransferase domain-containing protein [Candidatus Lokiarchaeota archaeon]
MKNEVDATSRNRDSMQDDACLSEFRRPLFDTIIEWLHLPKGTKGLDAGCGIGFYTKILAGSVGVEGDVTGIDLSRECIAHAKENQAPNVRFEIGNLNSLRFKDNTFDWIWSADSLWPGPKELGCPAEDPATIIKEFHRTLKPGGMVAILFFSSYKFLPGYPLLEARLNTTSGATAPFIQGMKPMHHVMNAKHWLDESGFKDISAKTFLSDVNAPLDDNTRNALSIFFQMLWGESAGQVSEEDRNLFKRLRDPSSDDNILTNQHYCGFFTYTVFKGVK